MIEITQSILELLDKLNKLVMDQTGSYGTTYCPFTFESGGLCQGQVIKALGMVLWDSENDDREYIDNEIEKLEIFVVREFSEMTKELAGVDLQ